VSDRDAFLAAIHDAPDDDAPRLVFADWLEENGEPDRAEFMRVQIEMARERRKGNISSRSAQLFRRQKELIRLPSAEVARRCGAGEASMFVRGFPNELTVTASSFVELGSDISIWIGPNTRLTVNEFQGDADAIATQCKLCNVKSVVTGSSSDRNLSAGEVVTEFLRSPHLSGLEELAVRLPSNNLRSGEVRRWARSNQRAGEVRAFARSVVTAIVSAKTLGGLRSLDLSWVPIRSEGVMALADAPHLKSLNKLLLRNVGLGLPGIEALRDSPYLSGLKCLDLDENRLTSYDLADLFAHFGPGVVQCFIYEPRLAGRPPRGRAR